MSTLVMFAFKSRSLLEFETRTRRESSAVVHPDHHRVLLPYAPEFVALHANEPMIRLLGSIA